MSRDLKREAAGGNGHIEETDRVNLDDAENTTEPPRRVRVETATPARVEVVEARRDRFVAAMCALVLDTAKMMDPMLEIISARVLGFVAFGAAIGLTAYTLRMLEDGWQRVSVIGLFLLLAAWVVRRGR